MSEMVDQVARALYRAHHERGRRLYPKGAWERLDRFQVETWRCSARAAIAAADAELAASLRKALADASSADQWHKFGEGYLGLREAVEALVRELDGAAPPPP